MENNSRIAVLEKQCAALPEMQKKLEDLHRHLLEPSLGGEPPLLDRVRKAVRAYEQTSWLSKGAIWFVLTLGSLAGAGVMIFNFLSRFGK